jgi:hypothetical protein
MSSGWQRPCFLLAGMELVAKQVTPPSTPARIEHLECRAADGDRDVLRCWAYLDRPLTESEEVWFETAEPGSDLSPSCYLVREASVYFLCEAAEKSHWIFTLERFLQWACEPA